MVAPSKSAMSAMERIDPGARDIMILRRELIDEKERYEQSLLNAIEPEMVYRFQGRVMQINDLLALVAPK